MKTEDLQRWRMSASRVHLVHLIAVVLLMGHCTPGLLDRRHLFPFSRVHMYSKPTPDAFTVFRPMGVPTDETQEPFTMMEYPYLAPFHVDCMTTTMINHNMGNPDPERVQKILSELLLRYERRRLEGHHGGPPIRAIQLYRMHWDQVGTDFETVQVPDEFEVLYEIELETLQGASGT